MWQVAKILRRIPRFIQGILENKASDFITPGRVAALMSYLFWIVSESYPLTFPNQAILILAAFFLTLGIAHYGLKLWDRRKGRAYQDTQPLPLSSGVPPPTDDTLDNAEQKQRFQNFIWQVMGKACDCMQQVANQVHGTLIRREEKILRYSVDAYLFFMKPLSDTRLDLLDFLRARESLTNNDFILAQRLFIELYNIYEYRRPWLRDMAFETFPDFPALNLYKDWEKADRDMRNELEKILRDCNILAEKTVGLTLPATRRWEKGGS